MAKKIDIDILAKFRTAGSKVAAESLTNIRELMTEVNKISSDLLAPMTKEAVSPLANIEKALNELYKAESPEVFEKINDDIHKLNATFVDGTDKLNKQLQEIVETSQALGVFQGEAEKAQKAYENFINPALSENVKMQATIKEYRELASAISSEIGSELKIDGRSNLEKQAATGQKLLAEQQKKIQALSKKLNEAKAVAEISKKEDKKSETRMKNSKKIREEIKKLQTQLNKETVSHNKLLTKQNSVEKIINTRYRQSNLLKADAKKKTAEYNKAIQKSADIQDSEVKSLKAILKLTKDISSSNTKLTQEKLNQQKTQIEINDLHKRQTQSVSKTEKGMGNILLSAIGFNESLQAVKRAARLVVQVVSELDQSLTDIAVVTRMNRQEVYNMLGTYQKLAINVGLTTTEVIKLSTQFFRQGKNQQEALKLTETAAKLARIAAIDAAEAADYLTSTLNGFNLSGVEAVSVTDKLANLSAQSATSVEELASALQKVAPSAQSAGVSLDNMLGFIAKGIETTREAPENIGTAFKTIFARMSELKDLGATVEDGMTLSRVDEALQAVGVTLVDVVNGGFRPLDEVLIDLGMKWDTLNSFQKSYVGTALAGTRQQSRLLAVMSDFPRTMELIEKSQTSSGTATRQHAEYMKGMEAAVANLKTSFQQLITVLTNSDVVIFLIQALSTGLGVINVLLDTIVGKVAIFLGGLKAASLATKQWSSYLAKIISAESVKDLDTRMQKIIKNLSQMEVLQKGMLKQKLKGFFSKKSLEILRTKKALLAGSALILTGILFTVNKIYNSTPKSEEMAKLQKALYNIKDVLVDIVELIKRFGAYIEKSINFITGGLANMSEEGTTIIAILGVILGLTIAIAVTVNSFLFGIPAIIGALTVAAVSLSYLLLSAADKASAAIVAAANNLHDLQTEIDGLEESLKSLEDKWNDFISLERKNYLTDAERKEMEEIEKWFKEMDDVSDTHWRVDIQDKIEDLNNQIRDAESEARKIRDDIAQRDFLSSGSTQLAQIEQIEEELEKAAKEGGFDSDEYKQFFEQLQKERFMQDEYKMYSGVDLTLEQLEDKRIEDKIAEGIVDKQTGETLQKYLDDLGFGEDDDNVADTFALLGNRKIAEEYYEEKQAVIDAYLQELQAEAKAIKEGYYEVQDIMEGIDAENFEVVFGKLSGLDFSQTVMEGIAEIDPQYKSLMNTINEFGGDMERLNKVTLEMHNSYSAFSDTISGFSGEKTANEIQKLKESIQEAYFDPDVENIEDQILRDIAMIEKFFENNPYLSEEMKIELFAQIDTKSQSELISEAEGLRTQIESAQEILSSEAKDGASLRALYNMTTGLENQEEIINRWRNGTISSFDIVSATIEANMTNIAQSKRKLDAQFKEGLIDEDSYVKEMEQLSITSEEMLRDLSNLQLEISTQQIEEGFDALDGGIDRAINSLNELEEATAFLESIQELADLSARVTRISLGVDLDSQELRNTLAQEAEEMNKNIILEASRINLERQKDAAAEAREVALINVQEKLSNTIEELVEKIEEGEVLVFDGIGFVASSQMQGG